jgi:hypothetical protein
LKDQLIARSNRADQTNHEGQQEQKAIADQRIDPVLGL